ncbi:MAG: AAA family ATPase [Variibacter sp.]|nr:AAA family ATPase [Variibacter sp.]
MSSVPSASIPTAPVRILLLSTDAEVVRAAGEVLTKAAGFELAAVQPGMDVQAAQRAAAGARALLVDMEGEASEAVQAIFRAVMQMERRPPVIALTAALDPATTRRLLQLQIADFLLKPIAAADLKRACVQAVQASAAAAPRPQSEIIAFLPASGGVGVTTLAIEAALLLTRGGRQSGKATCLVDLDFQHGACADYLDLEPRLDLNEIEPRPERLDSQLLEVMISQHASGLSVICAPNRPAEMRSFDPAVVTRLLDLVSVRFDHVVLDMPRTWFAWTDTILLGCDKALVVAEATVPGLRHANALIAAIKQRLGEEARPRVIVNRFEQKMFASGVKRADITQALGDALAGTVPNNYQLVREAIDRGVPLDDVKPRSNVSLELKKIISPAAAARSWRSPLAAAGARLGLVPAT